MSLNPGWAPERALVVFGLSKTTEPPVSQAVKLWYPPLFLPSILVVPWDTECSPKGIHSWPFLWNGGVARSWRSLQLVEPKRAAPIELSHATDTLDVVRQRIL